MPSAAKILLVAASEQIAAPAAGTLASVGTVIQTTEFSEAKLLLTGRPALLVTFVKLGAYNGLHLAMRAAAIGTRAIVIGDLDPVLERDAHELGAKYLTLPIVKPLLLEVATEILRARTERRSIRRKVKDVTAVADHWPALVLDVSYEGMRIEADTGSSLPRYFELQVPHFKFACQVERIWTAPAGKDGSHLSCGVALFSANPETALEWRALVDTIPIEPAPTATPL